MKHIALHKSTSTYIKGKECSLVRDLLHNLRSCNVLPLRNSFLWYSETVQFRNFCLTVTSLFHLLEIWNSSKFVEFGTTTSRIMTSAFFSGKEAYKSLAKIRVCFRGLVKSVFNLTLKCLLRKHLMLFHLESSPRSACHPIRLKNDPSKNTDGGGIKTGELGRKDFKVPACDFLLTVFYLKNAPRLPCRVASRAIHTVKTDLGASVSYCGFRPGTNRTNCTWRDKGNSCPCA
jgi:hypothetical protein